MGFNKEVEQGGREIALLPSTAITAAGTTLGAVFANLPGVKALELQAVFTYISGGTTAKAYVQTSLDGGSTWIDVASFAFALTGATKVSKVSVYAATAAALTPTDGALADNTILDGILGDQFRIKIISVGIYAGTTLAVSAVAKG